MTEPENSAEWTPAFPRQRPPFQPGHTLSTRHGAYSDRFVLPVAEAVLADLLPSLPDYLREPRYGAAVRAYATCLARLHRVSTWLESQATDEGGIPEVTGRGEVRGAMDLLLRLEREAERHRNALGLTPLAASRLGRNVAQAQVSILDLWEQAQAEARQAEPAVEADDDEHDDNDDEDEDGAA